MHLYNIVNGRFLSIMFRTQNVDQLLTIYRKRTIILPKKM